MTSYSLDGLQHVLNLLNVHLGEVDRREDLADLINVVLHHLELLIKSLDGTRYRDVLCRVHKILCLVCKPFQIKMPWLLFHTITWIQ